MAVQAHQQQQHSENLLGISSSFCGSSSQEWLMDNINGFDQQLYLSLQQQQQLQLQQQMMLQNHQQHRNNNNNFSNHLHNQNPCFDYCGQQQQQQLVSTSNNNHDSFNSSSMAFTQSLFSQVEKQQRQEIDRFVALQNERLRLALHEQRKQQFAVMLGSIESKAMNLLQQKNDQLSEATRKTMELEECLRKSEMENQLWQKIAKENEAMVIALHNTLDQVKENVYCYSSAAAEDAGSCCDNYSADHNNDVDDNNNQEQEQVEENSLMMNNSKIVCKGCNSRDSCILLFPCRHLCLCKSCDTFSSHCPVCKCVKNGSMEVYMSMP